MIDLETLASSSNAAVIQIGACPFNLEMGEIDQPMTVLVKPNLKIADVSVDTICWWLEQSDAARRSVAQCRHGRPEQMALADLNSFIAFQCAFEVQAWAMPPEFDLVILRNMAERHDMMLPWHFAMTRDLRTLERLVGASKPDRIAPSVAHDAGRDAEAQALTAIKYFKMLNGERDALRRFKDFVHKRLDDAGVETHPDGPHSKEGCRIGDRLDIVLEGKG